MVQMDLNDLKEVDLTVDLESGTNALIVEESNKFDLGISDSNSVESLLENGLNLSEKKKKGKKKSNKKPPKPPRPPRAPSMDAADLKLMREINELAMMKRARIERMKALKRMKNAKTASSSSNGTLVPWIITLIFCLVIIWQGVYPRGSSSLRFHGSPEASVGARGGFISVQFYNASASHDSSSAPLNNNVEQVSGHDKHEGGTKAEGLSYEQSMVL